ncbi:sialic acid-binding Ig-like lectin 12 [Sinocyclocheilus grahami]|uniref:sialic acid-binding Ig-like lectin 12 n=1 Tax=Sinocyclocheilus grahami TaxID=75366 RepID=UPI0007ACDC9A|nr:PREDICTED: sialic acid-binding Ig-like lectin 12 [Sinocyclocheilus grahami]
MVEEKDKLMWPLLSPENECSVILWDFSGNERIEEYGLMLKWRTNETHIYDERVRVSYSTAKLNISLNTEVLVAGKQAFITCTLPDLCLGSDPNLTWKGLSSKKLYDIRYPRKMNTHLIFSQQLLYMPVPEDHQAEITCEATFGRNRSASATMTLKVHSHPQILNSSACSLQQDQLTCVCVSQGVPLPDIHWPLQNNADLNMVRASDCHITVKSTFTMTVEDLTRIGSLVCQQK